MKKFLFVLVCAISTLTTSAQYASDASRSFFSTKKSDQSVTLGIRGGLNIANLTISEDGYDLSLKDNVGFNIGVCVDIPMMESLYLQSGLYYTVKGSKEEDGDLEVKYTPSYLEIPILVSYRYNFSDFTQLQVNFGPYIAYGIGGKWKKEYEGETEEGDFFDDSIKKFDAGLAFGAGITLGHVYVGVNYDLGLTNIAKDSDSSIKNRCFSINVGYNL